MRILELRQGTPEWHAARQTHYRTASRTPVIMGASKFQTRDELMLELSTGITEEITPAKQVLFDSGHETEAAACEILGNRLGEELYNVTALSDDFYMLASLDGVPLSQRLVFEHKKLNQRIVAQINADKLEPMYYWQLEAELYVCDKAEKAIFVCSDGTEENFHTLEYVSRPERRAKMLAAWQQFDADYAAYVPKVKEAPATPKTRVTLPVAIFKVGGELQVTHNLAKLLAPLQEFCDAIPKEPKSDQEYVDALQDCKSLDTFAKGMKINLAQAKAGVADLAEMERLTDEIVAIADRTRIDREKTIEAHKKNLKITEAARGRTELSEHIDSLNKKLGGRWIPEIEADFAAAVHNKRNMDSLKAAVNATLTDAKVRATQIALTIGTNLALLEKKKDHLHLFSDKATILTKATDDFELLVMHRISAHEVAEKAKADKLREELEAAATAKATADAAAATARAVEEARADERAKAAAAPAPAPAPAPEPAAESKVETGAEMAPVTTTFSTEIPVRTGGGGYVRSTAAPAADPTLNIGEINRRFQHFKFDAAGLEALGFTATKVKGASLYNEADWVRICTAVMNHVKQCALRKEGTQ